MLGLGGILGLIVSLVVVCVSRLGERTMGGD